MPALYIFFKKIVRKKGNNFVVVGVGVGDCYLCLQYYPSFATLWTGFAILLPTYVIHFENFRIAGTPTLAHKSKFLSVNHATSMKKNPSRKQGLTPMGWYLCIILYLLRS